MSETINKGINTGVNGSYFKIPEKFKNKNKLLLYSYNCLYYNKNHSWVVTDETYYDSQPIEYQESFTGAEIPSANNYSEETVLKWTGFPDRYRKIVATPKWQKIKK